MKINELSKYWILPFIILLQKTDYHLIVHFVELFNKWRL